jgi:hypothetical protein
MQQEQVQKEANAEAAAPVNPRDLAETPQCCGTGCAVCVHDYPELFSSTQMDSETLAMLEAIEQAQAQVGQLIAGANHDLQ